MEWWLPYAVMAAALVISMIAPMPLPRSRRDSESRAQSAGYDQHEDDEPEPAQQRGRARPAPRAESDDLDPPQQRGRARPAPRAEPDDLDPPQQRGRSRPAPRAEPDDLDPPPRGEPTRQRATYTFDKLDGDDEDDRDRDRRAEPTRQRAAAPEPRRAPPPEPPPRPEPPRPEPRRQAAPPPPHGAVNGSMRRKPVTDRPGVDAPSYFRDPTALSDWPQAKAVEETVRAFIDRWGGSKPAATTFRKVEVVPASNERAFAFLLAVEPERRGKETTVLARVCIPGENADRPSRFLVTKYFDHMGERFRQDVAKTPQHSRGIIQVRDVPGDDGRGGAVALDFEVPLVGDPYDDIRSDDVTQYKNLLNIMRMFA